MKTVYLTFANVWAVVGLILILGATTEGSNDFLRITFFGQGNLFDPTIYALIDIACFAVAAYFLVLFKRAIKEESDVAFNTTEIDQSPLTKFSPKNTID